MARSERKNLTGVTLANTANNIEAFDITNFSGVSVTVRSNNVATNGSVKLQYSNKLSSDSADWTDVPVSIAPASVALVANGSATIASSAGIHAGFVRAVVTLAAGADTDYEIYYLAKDF